MLAEKILFAVQGGILCPIVEKTERTTIRKHSAVAMCRGEFLTMELIKGESLYGPPLYCE